MNKYDPPQSYMPHRPPMLFISEVEAITDDMVVCKTNTDSDGPMKLVLSDDGTLDSYFLFEAMAQTIGAWAGHTKKIENEELKAKDPQGDLLADIGLLLSIRNGNLLIDKVPKNSELRITMYKLLRDGQVASFEGNVFLGEKEIANGRITVYQPRVSEFARLFSN